jgi:hypothetical protein
MVRIPHPKFLCDLDVTAKVALVCSAIQIK